MPSSPAKKSPGTCSDTIRPLVDESIVKYERGIIATILLLNHDRFDKQLYREVYYILKKNHDSFDKMRKIASLSPVGREIMNAGNISDSDKEQIFNIWYLRQYPYGGEDIWKTQSNPSRAWKDYLNMADFYRVEAAEALRDSGSNGLRDSGSNVLRDSMENYKDTYNTRGAEGSINLDDSPRVMCEKSCNSTYSKGTDVWRICMSGCKELRDTVDTENDFNLDDSPRVMCEKSCKSAYPQGSDMWRICMSGCKDMRND